MSPFGLKYKLLHCYIRCHFALVEERKSNFTHLILVTWYLYYDATLGSY